MRKTFVLIATTQIAAGAFFVSAQTHEKSVP